MWESWWSLGIDNFCPVSSLRLRLFQSRSRSRHWDSDFSVSVSVSSMRLRHFQSRSHHWDLEIFSLGLVNDTQPFSVSVSVSSLRLRHFQSWSRWSKSGLANPCYNSKLQSSFIFNNQNSKHWAWGWWARLLGKSNNSLGLHFCLEAHRALRKNFLRPQRINWNKIKLLFCQNQLL